MSKLHVRIHLAAPEQISVPLPPLSRFAHTTTLDAAEQQKELAKTKAELEQRKSQLSELQASSTAIITCMCMCMFLCVYIPVYADLHSCIREVNVYMLTH